MSPRFNPAPGWPVPPEGFEPGPGWVPDAAWPPMPDGWPLWVDEDGEPAPPPPAFTYVGVPPPAERQTSKLAIASLVFGILGGAMFAIVLGIVALVHIKRTGSKGRGLAIAGLALAAVWTVVLTVVVLSAVGQNMPAKAGPGPGATSVFALRVGDCFQSPTTDSTVLSVTKVDCTAPHNAQVYSSFANTFKSYPGDKAIMDAANTRCDAGVNDALDQTLITPTMTENVQLPNSASWRAGDRTTLCIVLEPAGNITQSVLLAKNLRGQTG
jgi:Domain of unknown function (DUF4190)/Septum formation